MNLVHKAHGPTKYPSHLSNYTVVYFAVDAVIDAIEFIRWMAAVAGKDRPEYQSREPSRSFMMRETFDKTVSSGARNLGSSETCRFVCYSMFSRYSSDGTFTGGIARSRVLRCYLPFSKGLMSPGMSESFPVMSYIFSTFPLHFEKLLGCHPRLNDI